MIGPASRPRNRFFFFWLAFTRRPAFSGRLGVRQDKKKIDIVHFRRLLAQALSLGLQRPVAMYIYIYAIDKYITHMLFPLHMSYEPSPLPYFMGGTRPSAEVSVVRVWACTARLCTSTGPPGVDSF